MGRTPKPLAILVHPALADKPEVKALADKGHQIVTGRSRDYCPSCHHVGLEEYDLVLGPNCWRMDESMLDYLELAIKGARIVKYPKESVASGVTEGKPTSVGGDNEQPG